MDSNHYEKVISEYKSKFTELDKAIAARDKLIDDLRKKVTEYRNKFYDIQHENDDLTEHIESLRNMNNHNVRIHDKNMKKIKEEMKNSNAVHANEINELQSSKMLLEEEFALNSKKLNIAQNVITNLKEKVDQKDEEIANLQQSKSPIKFTSETQTSLADELKEAVVVNKYSNEKKMLIEKFASIQTKINLQIDQLFKSIQHLSQKKPERCLYGWECKRRFCKYSHEYLYSYSKFASSKCDETFNTSDPLEKNQKNLHIVTKEIAVNLQPKFSKSNKRRTEVKENEKKEETSRSSSSSSSPVTNYIIISK